MTSVSHVYLSAALVPASGAPSSLGPGLWVPASLDRFEFSRAFVSLTVSFAGLMFSLLPGDSRREKPTTLIARLGFDICFCRPSLLVYVCPSVMYAYVSCMSVARALGRPPPDY